MKKQKVLSMILTIAMVMGAFASVTLAMGEITISTPSSDNAFAGIVGKVLGFIQYAAWAIAIGMMIYIGIKYMMSGAGKKAEVKDTLLPYLIGAICVGAATTIASFAIGFATAE